MNNVFELKMYLLNLHAQGDKALSQGKLPCKDENGNLTGWEFDKEPYYNRGMRFIGLGMYQEQWNTPLWKQAYSELVEDGRLIENPDHAFHFQFVPLNEDDFYKNVLEYKLCVPYHLRSKYNQYIKSPQWDMKRKHILNLYGHKCSKCGSSDNLNIHHKTYINLFNEPDEDLDCLCEACHKKVHGV